MQLRLVLNAFEQGRALSLTQLSRRLGIEPGALEGMLQFWVKKGKLREVGLQGCTTCGARGGCPILIATARRYELVNGSDGDARPVLPCQAAVRKPRAQ
jgi:hypothetical protein